MFLSGVSRALLYSNRNTKVVPARGKLYGQWSVKKQRHGLEMLNFFSEFFKDISLKKDFVSQLQNIGNQIRFNHGQLISIVSFRTELLKIRSFLKNHSFQIVRNCTQQCECVVAHRIRRGQQIFNLYSKLWDEVALRELGRRLRKQFAKKGKEMFFSAVGVSAFSWEKSRITDDEMIGYTKELEEVANLCDTTITCQDCRLRRAFDKELPQIAYCQCSASKSASLYNNNDWVPFIEREDTLIWRKEHDTLKGLFAFKVYGRYNDVSAEDFLQVQVDTQYRKEWDNTAATLKVIDSDPKTNSDIVYWEMEWPRLFSNRDYVFNRRYMICHDKNLVVIVNKCIDHPSCPELPENHRVKEYWSYIVIKPFTSMTEPGIEFVLTYFDNPGVCIPSALSAWVAMSGLPEFLTRLRAAAKELAARQTTKKTDMQRAISAQIIGHPSQSTDDTVSRDNFFHKFNASRLFL